ncbi:hypothetical protein ACFOGJ_16300 [Marinibaculum pumilum]|uniref:Uncharacterized protein n=1 Tax=Marinibaculum pumilum TaxID=1766165 RepID=A0ABV7L2H8_9PROT
MSEEKCQPEVLILPDGSAAATLSTPLPKDHWLYANEGYSPPPMPFRCGTDNPRHHDLADMICAAARYAIRGATMNGKAEDIDPDAMVQNFVVGMLGYHTPDGLCDDAWANPDPVPEPFAETFKKTDFAAAAERQNEALRKSLEKSIQQRDELRTAAAAFLADMEELAGMPDLLHIAAFNAELGIPFIGGEGSESQLVVQLRAAIKAAA